jgi:hypothetical protein
MLYHWPICLKWLPSITKQSLCLLLSSILKASVVPKWVQTVVYTSILQWGAGLSTQCLVQLEKKVVSLTSMYQWPVINSHLNHSNWVNGGFGMRINCIMQRVKLTGFLSR